MGRLRGFRFGRLIWLAYTSHPFPNFPLLNSPPRISPEFPTSDSPRIPQQTPTSRPSPTPYNANCLLLPKVVNTSSVYVQNKPQAPFQKPFLNTAPVLFIYDGYSSVANTPKRRISPLGRHVHSFFPPYSPPDPAT